MISPFLSPSSSVFNSLSPLLSDSGLPFFTFPHSLWISTPELKGLFRTPIYDHDPKCPTQGTARMMRVALQLFNERRNAQEKRWVPFLDFYLSGHGQDLVGTSCGLYLQWCFWSSFALLLTWTRRNAQFSADHREVISDIQWSSSVTRQGKVFTHHHKTLYSPSLWQVGGRKLARFPAVQNPQFIKLHNTTIRNV